MAGLQELEQLPYREDRLAVMMPADHPMAGCRNPGLKDIARETFVSLRENSALTQMLAAQADALGISLSIKIRVASLDALCRMVHAGLGMAIMPQQVAELHQQSLNVVVQPLSDAWAERKISIVFPDRRQLSATAETLLKFLTQRN